jgi:hypothetical protein
MNPSRLLCLLAGLLLLALAVWLIWAPGIAL